MNIYVNNDILIWKAKTDFLNKIKNNSYIISNLLKCLKNYIQLKKTKHNKRYTKFMTIQRIITKMEFSHYPVFCFSLRSF